MENFSFRRKGRDNPLPPSAPFDVKIARVQIALKVREKLANAHKRATETRRRPPDRKGSKTRSTNDGCVLLVVLRLGVAYFFVVSHSFTYLLALIRFLSLL